MEKKYILVDDASLDGFGTVFGPGKIEEDEVTKFKLVSYGSGA